MRCWKRIYHLKNYCLIKIYNKPLWWKCYQCHTIPNENIIDDLKTYLVITNDNFMTIALHSLDNGINSQPLYGISLGFYIFSIDCTFSRPPIYQCTHGAKNHTLSRWCHARGQQQITGRTNQNRVRMPGPGSYVTVKVPVNPRFYRCSFFYRNI